MNIFLLIAHFVNLSEKETIIMELTSLNGQQLLWNKTTKPFLLASCAKYLEYDLRCADYVIRNVFSQILFPN